jgi:putative zinc finger protein
MDCRKFRKNHVAYVDDFLSAVEMEAMQRHLRMCTQCSRHDTVVRRSLLIVRNLPTIEPSPDFMARLNARLQEMGPAPRGDYVGTRGYLPSLGMFAMLAAGVVAIGYVTVHTTRYFTPEAEPVPAVAATVPVAPEPPIASAAFVASVPTGMPLWPAVLMAGEAPMSFASMEFRDTR